MKLKFPYKIALQLLPAAVKAQAVSATATLDSSLMVIGGQMKLQLELRQPEGLQVNFPHFTDTLTGQIEIVSATPIDSTIMGDGRVQLSQALTITSFDSGLHYLPPLYFEYMKAVNNAEQPPGSKPLWWLILLRMLTRKKASWT